MQLKTKYFTLVENLTHIFNIYDFTAYRFASIPIIVINLKDVFLHCLAQGSYMQWVCIVSELSWTPEESAKISN